MKDELGGRTMKEIFALRPKTYSYLKDGGYVDKKARGTKMCAIKQGVKFEYYKNSLDNKEKLIVKVWT